ncbi:diacylglycerol O-acyltransferase 2A [Raphidocelis subcapitata]|uniref:diacylglycerol O-acyltransferase n=1 Tax=Raphidocelis subcapitata TaxID=307507 RepID=A0A2V0PHN2_9CHLO|nr:diacylglycerol O-acyltransferase 2A [Raphidocelis subcapitata]|eukprot:GBF96565.1 diacylglycerol O-acyltransferase 2A [Raphidocelis subcapitata]
MLPWLGPQVAAAPFAWRVAAYTTLWVVHSFLVQTAIWGVLTVWRSLGLAKKNTRDPQLPVLRMLWADFIGYYSWMIGAGLVHAWYNPTMQSWDFTFNFQYQFWIQLPLLMAYDTWFFFAHRYAHINKWMFRHVHAMHHRNDAYLSVTSNSFETPADGLLVVGIPVGLIALFCCWTNNFWTFVIIMHTIACIFVFGHSGYDLPLDTVLHATLLALNPFLLIQIIIFNAARPMDHEEHHTNPRCNFALFYTFWDDLYDCAHYKHGVITWPLAAAHALFWPLFQLYYPWAFWVHPKSFFALLAANLLLPIPALAIKLLSGRVSRALMASRMFDVLRRDLLVTYAEKGEPGAFQADPARRYIFCYQPMGVQARGAWYTFAARGRGSPAAGLPDCKLAIGRTFWCLPLLAPVFAAMGCCQTSHKALKALLADKKVPTSVCITPGGFRETKYLQSYAVVLACRRGFARLSVETGTPLVPVVGIGEPHIAGAPAMLARITKTLVPYRPYPLKVVFGEPVVPKAGESADDLHARYCKSLLALGKAFNVPLRIVE